MGQQRFQNILIGKILFFFRVFQEVTHDRCWLMKIPLLTKNRWKDGYMRKFCIIFCSMIPFLSRSMAAKGPANPPILWMEWARSLFLISSCLKNGLMVYFIGKSVDMLYVFNKPSDHQDVLMGDRGSFIERIVVVGRRRERETSLYFAHLSIKITRSC